MHTTRKVRSTFVLMTAVSGAMVFGYWTLVPSWQLNYSTVLSELCKIGEDPNRLSVNRQSLLEHLHLIRKELHLEKDATYINSQLDDLIDFLGGKNRGGNVKNVVVEPNQMVKSKSVLEVCPEEWLGPKDGPFYFNSWEQVKCSNALPFEKVITILLYNYPKGNKQTCSMALRKVLAGLKSLYPKVPVIVAGEFNSCALSISSNVRVMEVNESSPGQVWNQMANLVKTPYILFGRELDNFMGTSNLQRQIRIISYNRHISVAGGSVRNLTGHWYVSCFQATLRNYVLKYDEGYYSSTNSCMFCDHLSGPFVARTNLVRSVQFDETLPRDFLFEDWFLRVRQLSHKMVSCPDVMYLASHQRTAVDTHTSDIWLPFVSKWELNRVVIPGGRVFSYTCSQANISCFDIIQYSSSSLLMPVCCMEVFATAIGVFDDFCRKHDIRYEFIDAFTLGIVKMKSLIPWDIPDGRFTFDRINTPLLSNNSHYFRNNGIVLHLHKNNNSIQHSFNTSQFSLEGFTSLSQKHSNSIASHLVPTQAMLHGHWVYVPHNPGSYVRDHFGHEVLWHAGYWKLKPYNLRHPSPNQFINCSIYGHHACLDQFSNDGNIQFNVPN